MVLRQPREKATRSAELGLVCAVEPNDDTVQVGNLAKLVDSLPEEVRDKLQAEMRAQLFVEDRLTLKAGTQGSLSDPAVKLKTRLPDIEKILKEYATNKALDLLFQKLSK